jgi:molybdopterin molybdotransferase
MAGSSEGAPMRELLALEAAQDWLAARAAPLPAERVALAAARGRIAAEPLAATADLPPAACAAVDGYALAADVTIGAGGYAPLLLPVPGAARPVAAGAALPAGADAVLPLDRAGPDAAGQAIEVSDALAPGDNVVAAGEELRAGDPLLAAGRPLDPAALALLALAGPAEVAVVRRPRVRLLLARAAVPDADGPLLAGLLARDGALVEAWPLEAGDPDALAAGLGAPGADLLLVAGRSGPAADDHAAAALAAAGRVAVRGIALAGAETAALGLAGTVPALLLPGAPGACLWSYELLAGPAVRRLGGRTAALPWPCREGRLGRKIVSAIGLVEPVPVARRGDAWEPLGAGPRPSLAQAAAADGLVLVPAGSEGFAAGALVPIYRFDEGGEMRDG